MLSASMGQECGECTVSMSASWCQMRFQLERLERLSLTWMVRSWNHLEASSPYVWHQGWDDSKAWLSWNCEPECLSIVFPYCFPNIICCNGLGTLVKNHLDIHIYSMSGINSTWSWYIILSICCWVLFSSILWRIFLHLYSQWMLVCSFPCVFGFGIKINADLIGGVWKCYPPLQSLEEFEKDWC